MDIDPGDADPVRWSPCVAKGVTTVAAKFVDPSHLGHSSQFLNNLPSV